MEIGPNLKETLGDVLFVALVALLVWAFHR